MPRRLLPAIAALVTILPVPGFAHHAMDGAVPATAWEGIASGIAHPVIGLDHLAFLLAAGTLAAAAPRLGGLWALAAFLGAGLVGALLHLAGTGLGPVEAAVALSVLLAGMALLAPVSRRRGTALVWLAAAFGAAGLFHGHAYAEAVVGAGPAPVMAYLATLVAVQVAIGLAAMAAARRFGLLDGATRHRRLAGMGVTAVGAVALVAAVLA